MIVLSGKRKTGAAVPVYLNVYDLTPINGYAYWLGLGVYHSGVQGALLHSFHLPNYVTFIFLSLLYAVILGMFLDLTAFFF